MQSLSVVDYVGVGPIFPTKTKLDTKEIVDMDVLQHLCSLSKVPIVAVGGITEKNLQQVVLTGTSFFAICSDIFDASDMSVKIQQLSQIIEEASVVTKRLI